MTVSPGSIIYGSDYNVIQALVTEVLGSGLPYGPTGSGDVTYGYGQPLQSSPVAPGQLITAAQWQALEADLATAWLHQSGSTLFGPTNNNTLNVLAAAYLSNLNTASTIVTNRMQAAPTQMTTATLGSATYGAAWGDGGNAQLIGNNGSITFPSTTAMQYFWNTGGTIRFQGFGPNQSGSTQDADWQAALSAFNFTLNYSVFTTLTSNPTQVYYAQTQPSPYNNSWIGLSMYVSGATITWGVVYYDAVPTNYSSYWGGPNTVSAGAGYIVYETYASGLTNVYQSTSISISNSWSVTG